MSNTDEDVSWLVEGVRGVDARLDEVRRARIAAGLGRVLDARAVERARASAARRRSAAAARWLVPVALAAAAWFVLVRPHVDGGGTRASTGAVTGPTSFDRLEVPPGTRARARLGRADLTLVGPAQLEVTRVAGADVTMRLSSGTLVGDYDGRAGGRLRIETPRLVADIVGTRFAIEATPTHARVSVHHGRVAVRDAATPDGAGQTFVGAGESWEVGRARTAPIEAPVAALLSTEAPDQPIATDETPAPTPAPAPARAPRASHPVAVVAQHEAPPQAPPVAAPATPAPVEEPAPAVQPPAAAVPPTPLPAPPISVAELYRRAEDAMARRDQTTARHWLEELVARHPADPAADSARFELARDALAAGAPSRAGRWIDELIAQGHDRSLVESARFLKCRIARDGGEPAEARTCLQRFRADHPRSVRDQEALATLVALARERGACDEARALAAEHSRLYPGVRLQDGERDRCPR